MRILRTPAAQIDVDAPAQSSSQHEAPKPAHLMPEMKNSSKTSSTTTSTMPTVPTVALDADVVSHNMAARLCISFVGHVLFLKNQVPFPIVQLARMPTSDNTSRVAKKRQELLNSFDTLASHLYTTFVALSTALALRGSPDKVQAGTGAEGASTISNFTAKGGRARVFFACALGPTVGTAKSRVMVGIDGLETRVWGLEGDVNGASDMGDEDEDEEDESGSEQEDLPISDDDVSPPLSRSLSPAYSSDFESSSEPLPLKAPLISPEDPELLRAAERLLSRTLASACAEDDGQGLASEMAPTQIHVLLRAPRRFDHPSWIPRQNLCTSLEGSLDDFLIGSGQAPAHDAKKRTKAGVVQGVWIKPLGNGSGAQTKIEKEQNLAEEDELIWWSWDGKLGGFSDW